MKLKYARRIKKYTNHGNIEYFIEHRRIEADQIMLLTDDSTHKLYQLQFITHGVIKKNKETLEVGENVLYLEIDGYVYFDYLPED